MKSVFGKQLISSTSRRSFQTTAFSQVEADLYLHPEQWMGLPAPKIFELYQQRVVRLGSDYQKSEAELSALLSTSKTTGVSTSDIRRIYSIKNEPGSEDLIAGRLGGFTPFKDDGNLPTYQYDEYTSSAQDLIDQHRTSRKYNRIAAYELPLLTKYRSEFVPPSKDKTLTVRYTNYIGESHPADKKVVVKANFDDFTTDLKLSDKEKHKLKLILGKRYNPIKNQIHLSVEKFKYPTQNFKYSLVLLENLLKEVKTERKGEEDYSDLPLDTRLYERKMRIKKKIEKINAFPEDWLRPQDAPVKKNSIEQTILEQLGQKANAN
ncbi:mitochondrial 37S ribosomal protein [Saccharomycopsis crataegensis]|uniref:Small ribosomal subunit protein mS35 n=1 Tax=Saccharomycopsis crataegensis TaxID=43959 RepID=A0AAV5QNW9_9ASCO|nr:mitochondrial 37S ribosomal protein [Saccharomycopsis crataegensis]